MYSQVHDLEPMDNAMAMQQTRCNNAKDRTIHSVLLKIAGAGVSGPIPVSLGGGGADVPDGAGSLLSKYLLNSPASSKGRLPSRRTMLCIVSRRILGEFLEPSLTHL
jgi:hypothetical protein